MAEQDFQTSGSRSPALEAAGGQGSLEAAGTEADPAPAAGEPLAPAEDHTPAAPAEDGPAPVAEGSARAATPGPCCCTRSSMPSAPPFSAAGAGAAGHYDDASVLATPTFGFALGANTIEGTKHLARSDAGAVVGLAAMPELRTLRPRLGAIADRVDPLAVQRAFATALVAAQEKDHQQVLFVDDHFGAYSGARPLAKGGKVARQRGARTYRLLRRARQHRRSSCLSRRGDPVLVQGAPAPQPTNPGQLGWDDPLRQAVAPTRPMHPLPIVRFNVRTQGRSPVR